MKASIHPVTFLGKTASVLNIVGGSVRLGHFANFNFVLTDADGTSMHHGDVTMPNEDYELWGNDDTYPVQFVAQKLGLTIVSINTPVVLPTVAVATPTP